MATKKYSTGNGLIKTAVVLTDFIIMNLLLYWASRYLYVVHIQYPPYFEAEPKETFIMANFSMTVSQFLINSLIHRRRTSFEEVFMSVMKLSLLQVSLMFISLRILGESGGMFQFMGLFLMAEFTLILASRRVETLFIKYFRQAGRNTRSVLFVGNDPALLILYRNLISDSSTGYKIVGYYADNDMENCPEAIGKLGDLKSMNAKIDILQKDALQRDDNSDTANGYHLSDIDEIFCCLSHDEHEQIMKLMKFCDKNIIHFYYVPRMSGNFLLNLQPEQLGETMVFTNHHEPLSHPFNQFVKRTFDIVVSALVCLVMLPFIPIIAWCIKHQSPGPIFFKQARTGHNGKTFTCLKFRSMHVNSEADTLQATKDDPRKFPFGNFIRKTNIDEFPQFFNVLKGDMSIVGPRPHMLAHTEQYGNIIDKYMVRHFSRPGITGYAQVNGCRGETKELWQMEERIQKDVWYIENWTFWLDIKIIFKTALSLFIHDKQAY